MRKERDMAEKAKVIAMTVLLVAVSSGLALAQVAPPAVLDIDVTNRVQYFQDNADPLKFATDPNRTTPTLPKNFTESVIISDIVAVNGQPVKGTVVEHIRMLSLTTAPNPGQAIADIVRNNIQFLSFEILNTDGTQVGTIVATGFGGGAAPPGLPLEVTQGNNAIVGGDGAFFGVRGHVGSSLTAQTVATRQASTTEDPANRRNLGGGRARFVLTFSPMALPQVVTTSGGPAITHSDFTLVTASKPAAVGEMLSAFVTGLGPTKPGVDPGKPFPASPLAAVNSPVEVLVNGRPAEVLAAVGFPGAVDGYQVNFRVPSDTAKGMATVQVSAAWIAGPAVTINIQ
jgi:uncharacterized protein (TIGR03437 family)